jgi:hypothetical protein
MLREQETKAGLTEVPDEQLLRMMQVGDQGAFTTLYRRRQGDGRALVLAGTPNRRYA